MFKRITLTAILLASVAITQAQTFRAGIEGAYNSTWLFNKNISDAGESIDYKSTFGGQFGVSGVYNFKDVAGISFGLLFSSYNQKYSLKEQFTGDKTEAENKIKIIDIPVLFRYTSENGPYFEVGPQFGIISKGTFSGDGVDDRDYESDEINSLNVSVQLGFGYDVKLSEKFTLVTGLRFGWGLSDVFKDDDSNNYEPTNTAAGGLHVGLHYNFSSN
ncbi:hypothetical protein BH11BAC2_BH11BAC2_26380 [soil metagenome]